MHRLISGLVAGSFLLAVTNTAVTSTAGAATRRRTRVRASARTAIPAAGPAVVGSGAATPFPTFDQPYYRTLRSVAADLDAMWAVEMPRLYKRPYRALTGYHPYTSVDLPPSCEPGRVPSYEAIAGNAYYCRGADFIAWDDEGLFPDIAQTFGEIGLATVIAHEMGHAIQARSATRLPSVFAELQADCFSGAWLARVTSNKSTIVKLEKGALDEAIQAILAFRDAPGVGAGTPGAHGNGFDRVNAFQIGFEEGNDRCVTFPAKPPLVTARSFQQGEDPSGNVALPLAISIAVRTTNAHFTTSAPGFVAMTDVRSSDLSALEGLASCAGAIRVMNDLFVICPTGGSDGGALVAYDATRMARIYRGTGDFGVAFAFAAAWSVAAQVKLGYEPGTASAAAELQADCFAGSWVGAENATTGADQLSPGDLDEALRALVGLPGQTGVFDRVAAVRKGFLNGISVCTR